MNIKEKAAWLSNFYQKVAEGETPEFNHLPPKHYNKQHWIEAPLGPRLNSDFDRYRLKPKPREWDVAVGSLALHFPVCDADFEREIIRVREVLDES